MVYGYSIWQEFEIDVLTDTYFEIKTWLVGIASGARFFTLCLFIYKVDVGR